ncbi:MAG: hypothetical protein ACKON8_14405, partial [Planctomycetota bacterium]
PRHSSDPAGTPGGSPSATLRQRVESWVRRSPPFTVSLSVHVLALLLLALCVVRVQRTRHAVLDLSFTTDAVDQPQPGRPETPVTIPAPAVEPEPVAIESSEPVVPDPAAAPRVEEAAPPDDEGRSAPTAPVVGALLDGRNPGRREALLAAFGGSGETEAAVAKALDWLKKTQGKDGLWSLQGRYADGSRQENRLAATAMALLAYQGAGHTTTTGAHAAVVQRAWKALAARQLEDGQFDVPPMIPELHRMYAHAQATIAACELAGMTRVADHRQVAERAIAFAVDSQGQDGGWRYVPGTARGDTSMTGWYMMALKSGQMAAIDVPPDTFDRVGAFLDGVAFETGARYGSRGVPVERRPLEDTSAVSAEGLLSRQFMGWRRDDPRLTAGVARLLAVNMPLLEAWGVGGAVMEKKDVYGWYYLTQVVHHRGGDDWRRWNAVMRDVLPKAQVKSGRDAGSWDPTLDIWGHVGGRLFMTCFCTYMLEVYYRHLPIYGDEALAVVPAAQPR